MYSDIVTGDCSGRRAVVGLELLQETQEQICIGSCQREAERPAESLGVLWQWGVGLGAGDDVAGGLCAMAMGLGKLQDSGALLGAAQEPVQLQGWHWVLLAHTGTRSPAMV